MSERFKKGEEVTIDISQFLEEMRKKRFLLDDAGEVIDLQTHQFIDYGKEIVDLLNEIDEKYIDEFSLRETLQLELQRVEEENEQLKKELQRMYDVATLNKAIEVLENKYDKMLSDGSDEVKDAMRHTVLQCIEDLDELKDDITAR
jgi:hypothetical protein